MTEVKELYKYITINNIKADSAYLNINLIRVRVITKDKRLGWYFYLRPQSRNK